MSGPPPDPSAQSEAARAQIRRDLRLAVHYAALLGLLAAGSVVLDLAVLSIALWAVAALALWTRHRRVALLMSALDRATRTPGTEPPAPQGQTANDP